MQYLLFWSNSGQLFQIFSKGMLKLLVNRYWQHCQANGKLWVLIISQMTVFKGDLQLSAGGVWYLALLCDHWVRGALHVARQFNLFLCLQARWGRWFYGSLTTPNIGAGGNFNASMRRYRSETSTHAGRNVVLRYLLTLFFESGLFNAHKIIYRRLDPVAVTIFNEAL